jgi:5-methyltetrahydrofolate--homocysteine methyltransferase
VIREPSAASLYTAIPFHQDASVLIIGERTNANGSKAFREAMLGEDWQKCLDTAKGRPATELTCSNSASTVGRDCVADMNA